MMGMCEENTEDKSQLDCVPTDQTWDSLNIQINKGSNWIKTIKMVGIHESISI